MSFTFRSLTELTTLDLGQWSARPGPARGDIALTHPQNTFEIHLHHARGGRFETRAIAANDDGTTDVERLLMFSDWAPWKLVSFELSALSPATLHGTSGLAPRSLAAARAAWHDGGQFASPDSDWRALELDEGWVFGYAGEPHLLSFCRDSNGWVGLFDATSEGALLESVLNPTYRPNQLRLRALLAS